jgi:hypothetical protein
MVHDLAKSDGAGDTVLSIPEETMRILLAVTTHWPGVDNRIIAAAYKAADMSGADGAQMFTVGRTDATGAMDLIPGNVDHKRVHVGPNRGHQEGERDLVWGAIRWAEEQHYDWIVKCAADCLHVAQGWAVSWCEYARGMDAVIIGDRHPELHNWHATGNTDALLHVMPQTKVFAATTDFLRVTWPTVDSGFIERDWEVRIRATGLWPLVRLIAGDEVDHIGSGSQEVWRPISGPLRFEHCHSASELPCIK